MNTRFPTFNVWKRMIVSAAFFLTAVSFSSTVQAACYGWTSSGFEPIWCPPDPECYWGSAASGIQITANKTTATEEACCNLEPGTLSGEAALAHYGFELSATDEDIREPLVYYQRPPEQGCTCVLMRQSHLFWLNPPGPSPISGGELTRTVSGEVNRREPGTYVLTVTYTEHLTAQDICMGRRQDPPKSINLTVTITAPEESSYTPSAPVLDSRQTFNEVTAPYYGGNDIACRRRWISGYHEGLHWAQVGTTADSDCETPATSAVGATATVGYTDTTTLSLEVGIEAVKLGLNQSSSILLQTSQHWEISGSCGAFSCGYTRAAWYQQHVSFNANVTTRYVFCDTGEVINEEEPGDLDHYSGDIPKAHFVHRCWKNVSQQSLPTPPGIYN